jgi:LPS export ABC transporter protein LptC
VKSFKAAVLFVGALALFFSGCKKEEQAPSAPSEAFELLADNVFYMIRETMLSNGVITAVLTADTAYVWNGESRVEMKVVVVAFHDERGNPTGTLTSTTGEFDGDVFIGSGDVVLITEGASGSRTLRTDQIIFNLGEDHISTDHPFTLEEAGRTSRGTNFRTDSRFTDWEVRGLESTGVVSGGAQF